MYLWSTEYILSSHALTASSMVLVYDYIITFGNEVNYMWLQPWKFGTFLFFANRYIPFIDTLMGLYLAFSVPSPELCKAYYIVITWLIAIGLMVSELILLLRTWSIWERSRRILYFLGILSVGTFIPGIYVTVKEIESFKFGLIPEGGRGCYLYSANKLIMLAYILVGVSETVVVTLTIVKGYRHIRNTRKSWVKHIYRHGILFYIYLLIITIANVIIPFIASEPKYKNYLVVPQRIFHSIFCNRVVLLIQGQITRRRQATDEIARARTVSKSNYTANIMEMETGMEDTNYTTHGGPDLDLDLDDDTQIMEMSTYHHDWTM